jgi:phage terminase large subunit-like protein
MAWWDACVEALPPLGSREPVVIALDAATTNDSFGMAVVSRHPARPADVALRMVMEWRPVDGVIRFGSKDESDTPRGTVERLIRDYNVIQLCGDPYQLHQMFTEIRDTGRVYVAEFNQGAERLESDNQLKHLILERRIAHNGDPTARRHIENADAKVDADAHKLRIVKREQSLKIDVAVCISMAAKRCLDLNL